MNEWTDEHLAAFSHGDLDLVRSARLKAALDRDDALRSRLNRIRAADLLLRALPRSEPSASGILTARQALARALKQVGTSEIMTLDEVAAYLNISLDELDALAEQLPAFEVAGRLRMRRVRLDEWIQQQERAFARRNAANATLCIVKGSDDKGVA